MSEPTIASLTAENAELKKQIENATANHSGLLAQVDAHKGMLSESIQSSLNLRTNLIMFQKKIQELSGVIQEKDKLINGLNQQLTDATAKIASYEDTKSAEVPPKENKDAINKVSK
jgi:predicted RNase H-like nuclease (RuvC/YqgF family)